MAQFDRAAGGLVLHDKAGSKVVEVAEVGPAPVLRAIHQDGKAAFFLVAIEGDARRFAAGVKIGQRRIVEGIGVPAAAGPEQGDLAGVELEGQ